MPECGTRRTLTILSYLDSSSLFSPLSRSMEAMRFLLPASTFIKSHPPNTSAKLTIPVIKPAPPPPLAPQLKMRDSTAKLDDTRKEEQQEKSIGRRRGTSVSERGWEGRECEREEKVVRNAARSVIQKLRQGEF